MPFILKEGLDYCEEDVRLTKLAIEEGETGQTVSFEEFDRRARQAIGNAGKAKAA